VETDGPAIAVGQEHFGVAVCHAYGYHFVVFADGDGVDPVLARPRIGFQQGLFNHTLLGTEQQVVGVDEFLIGLQVFHPDEGVHLVVGINVEQVLDGAPLGIFGPFWYFIHLQPIASAL